MDLNQTDFGSLIRIAQSTVSQLETQRRDEPLPPDLAERVLELWECFATHAPPENFEEAVTILAEFRKRNAARPAPVVMDAQEPAPSGQSWPIHFAHGPLPPEASLIELVPLVTVETRAPVTRTFAAVEVTKAGAAASGRGEGTRAANPVGRLQRMTAVATLALLLVPAGCFQHLRSEDPHGAEWKAWRGAPEAWNGIGEDPADLGSEPLPEGPVPNQKLAPCNPKNGELEINKVCWWRLDPSLPCPSGAVMHEGKCIVPVPKPRSKPVAKKVTGAE
ncbi:MAG TPA: hypothetical protein VK447_08920 [Myxococcaceae bacterium]|nr:hypothetical protein [Myxococcaceae bacterium]